MKKGGVTAGAAPLFSLAPAVTPPQTHPQTHLGIIRLSGRQSLLR